MPLSAVEEFDLHRGPEAFIIALSRPSPIVPKDGISPTEQPSFSGSVLGDVGDPQLIWTDSMELAVGQIIGCDHPRAAV